MSILKRGVKNEEVLEAILDALYECDGNCLDNSWEVKKVAAHVASKLTGRDIDPPYNESEADEAAQYE